MLPLLMQRAVPRVLAPAVATLGRRPTMLARQQLVTRTFLTTLFTSEPAAKSATTKAKKAEDEEGKKPAKKTTSSKTETKAKAKAKPATKSKPKAKAKAKPAVTRNSDLETRLAHGTLKSTFPFHLHTCMYMEIASFLTIAFSHKDPQVRAPSYSCACCVLHLRQGAVCHLRHTN